jgi:hypothetical protein
MFAAPNGQRYDLDAWMGFFYIFLSNRINYPLFSTPTTQLLERRRNHIKLGNLRRRREQLRSRCEQRRRDLAIQVVIPGHLGREEIDDAERVGVGEFDCVPV